MKPLLPNHGLFYKIRLISIGEEIILLLNINLPLLQKCTLFMHVFKLTKFSILTQTYTWCKYFKQHRLVR